MEQNRSATTVADRRTPEPSLGPPPEVRLLHLFLGEWNAEGVSFPDAPIPGRMVMTENYEWLPGGFFMVNRGEMRVAGLETVPHLWVFGYDPDKGTYPIRTFDGAGNFREYQGTTRDRTWKFTGPSERASIVFSEDGHSFTSTWELSKDGKNWRPLCEVKATRAR